MRMSDTVDSETMKVSEDRGSSPKDNATKSEPSDSQSGRDELSLNNKKEIQVKSCKIHTVQEIHEMQSVK